MPAILSITDLTGPAGKLEAILNTGADNAPFAVMLCHPHPPSGGTMHNKVVYHATKAFTGLGLPVLRFNFRGVGLSEGTHDRGLGERDDATAALNWLQTRFGLPIIAAGFSFGAAVALEAAHARPDVSALIALGLPVHVPANPSNPERRYEYPFLAQSTKPKLFLSGDTDKYASKSTLNALLSTFKPPKDIIFVPNSDHFFANSTRTGLTEMQSALQSWLKNTLLTA
jgi:alpha/beta superfamily hydrolase